MTTLSQKNLLNLARQNEAKGNLTQAIQNVEEALRIGYSQDLVIELCKLYLKNHEQHAAYALIKEEKDLFSESKIFGMYNEILQANHFFIEALEIQNLSDQKLLVEITPANAADQKKIMTSFKQKSEPTQFDYQQLFKLDLVNFKNFAQSLLLDPSCSFAVRIALCEDLIRLGIADKMQVMVLGNMEDFIPKQAMLLAKEPVYREVISGIGSRYYHRPSQLPAVLGEVNLILGSLYPKINKYVDEPDSFARDIASYIEKHDGRGNQKLFETVDHYLPK